MGELLVKIGFSRKKRHCITVEEGSTGSHLGLCVLDAFLESVVFGQVVVLITVELHDVRIELKQRRV